VAEIRRRHTVANTPRVIDHRRDAQSGTARLPLDAATVDTIFLNASW